MFHLQTQEPKPFLGDSNSYMALVWRSYLKFGSDQFEILNDLEKRTHHNEQKNWSLCKNCVFVATSGKVKTDLRSPHFVEIEE